MSEEKKQRLKEYQRNYHKDVFLFVLLSIFKDKIVF